jgi:hypothetical protein
VSKGRLTILLIFALVLLNIQCAAFCTVESCNGTGTVSAPGSNVPPCHRHQDAPGKQPPAPCSHRLIQAVGATARVAHDPPAGDPAAGSPVVSSFASSPALAVDILSARAASPPGPDRISSVILRI